MSVKSKTVILDAIKEKFGDDTSDSTLSFLEDVSDTFDDLEAKSNDSTDWKAKYEENDKTWRQKYHDRFFSSDEDKHDDNDDDGSDEGEAPKSFDELFKTE